VDLIAQGGVIYKPSLNGAAYLSNLKYAFSSREPIPLEVALKVSQSSCDTSNASTGTLDMLTSSTLRLVTQKKK